MTSTPTRTVDNVVIATKGLQDRNINILDGTTVENKGKLILYSCLPYYIKKNFNSLLEALHIKQWIKTVNNDVLKHVKCLESDYGVFKNYVKLSCFFSQGCFFSLNMFHLQFYPKTCF